MPESTRLNKDLKAFKIYLSETIKNYDAIVIGEDSNIYLVGLVGIVQEVTQGLLPIYIGRSKIELANIKKKIGANNINALWIFDHKHNLTDDEPRGKQLIFDWHIEDDHLRVYSSYSLVGKIRHRGFQL